ncbi:hypothetical protein FSP39_012593 [Pinctada imbricata]|uniref:DnaJ homolog subfamily C member 10 n=1 Tax=Pinctada imbricata TaxID=66713 RepID=A0AA88XL35_PINIB|nr:hypothetical protein FSP39_012593 [Pinctada imbricata]
MQLDALYRLLCLFSVSLIAVIEADQDFYTLLGIDKGASTKEIRKAFKKLAVTKHPDKNVDDPEAHEKFLKITRAYEVLKDEDLRKKYDEHGEEGLKEDFNGGRRYESWKFYQEEFGIYDDDPEIITLSRSDFEISVQGTDDVWFINFYSPHCGHCHELAPTWREVARELEGVIRIGAVNCEDDWQLCRMQGIRSYPSLVMYPSKEKYHGERTTGQLVKHALKQIKAKVIELWSGNFESQLKSNDKHPWLVSYCGDGGDCLSKGTGLKLAAMLAELVNVAIIGCNNNEKLCKKLGHDYGTVYYDAGSFNKDSGVKITSLHAQDIALQVLSQLPDVMYLDKETFKKILGRVQDGQRKAWLIHFVDKDDDHDIEYRKLPAMLPTINVGRVNCKKLWDECQSLHINKFPTFYVFKTSGGFEIYYGRTTAHDVSAFAKDSTGVKLTSLGPDDFNHRKVGPNSPEPWFVDFFAPWCPPCMRLLPEFRKAAKDYGNIVNFGTVDCTMHTNLCRNYNIRSYPTTIFYNQSVPHQYHGHHSAHSMVEFIQDTMSPPVIDLDPHSFQALLMERDDDTVFLVDYFAPWCGPCQQLAPEWRRLAKSLKNTKNIFVGQVDCQKHSGLCRENQVRSYPNMRLYPATQRGKGSHFEYNGWHRDAESLRAWAYEFLPSKVDTVHWHDFYVKVLSSQTPWVIDYYAPWCGPCQTFKPEFERIAEELDGKVKAGKVNCDEEQSLCQQAGIMGYPSVRFYRGVRNDGMSQVRSQGQRSLNQHNHLA